MRFSPMKLLVVTRPLKSKFRVGYCLWESTASASLIVNEFSADADWPFLARTVSGWAGHFCLYFLVNL